MYPKRMKEILERYLADNKLTQAAFSKRLGSHGKTTLNRLMQETITKLPIEHVMDYSAAMGISTRQLLVMLGAIEPQGVEELEPELAELNEIIAGWPDQDKRAVLTRIKQMSKIARDWAATGVDIR